MNALGAKIGQFFGVKQCMFTENADDFETSVVSYGWHAETAPDLKGTYRTRDFLADAFVTAMMAGKPLIVRETQQDEYVNAESYGALGIRSFIMVPLVRDREWRFHISIIDDKPRDWRKDEIELLCELTTRIWTRLEGARAEEAEALAITSLRDSEARLRALASQLTIAEQEERRRISQILHDDLQQLLYGIQMRMLTIINDIEAGKTIMLASFAQEAYNWLGEAIQTTRQLTVDLSPPILKHEGLADMLHWLATQMRMVNGLHVELRAADVGALGDEDLRVMLFQSVRELLFNVVKHAATDRVTVELQAAAPGELVITIQDEGRGFDIAQTVTKGSGGFGLFSVKERLELFGGRMEIQSTPGQGSRITLYAPVSAQITESRLDRSG